MDDLFGRKDPDTFGTAPPPPKYKKRRRIDPSEDLKAIKQVLKDTVEQDITLDDFVLLVSPHTGDKGAALNKVMTEDTAAFHKMVIKIYDTMTQDVSDVLANEQMDLAKMYAEKQRICLSKITRALQEMRDIEPAFDFREYYKDPVKYLATLFKLADMPDDEEVELARRQLTYHRLQWLQSEGERLQAENNKLQEHLNELKKIQREEIVATVQKEQEEERKKAELEKQQAEMLNRLEELNDSLHDAIVTGEKKKLDAKKRAQQKAMKARRSSIRERPAWQGAEQPEWNVQAAAKVEETQVKASQSTMKAAAKLSLSSRTRSTAARPSTSRAPSPSTTSAVGTGAIKKRPVVKKKKISIKERPEWKDVDLQEFGVTQTAAEEAVPVDAFTRRASPRRSSLAQPAVPEEAFTRRPSPRRSSPVTQAATCPDTCPSIRAPPPESAYAGRRTRAPRDTWGGFY